MRNTSRESVIDLRNVNNRVKFLVGSKWEQTQSLKPEKQLRIPHEICS